MWVYIISFSLNGVHSTLFGGSKQHILSFVLFQNSDKFCENIVLLVLLKIFGGFKVETITKNSYVVFNYTLTDDQGRVLSSSEPHGPLDYIHGTGTLIPGLEKGMVGKKVGEAFNIDVTS